MKKNILHKTIASLMAFVVLFATMSFSIDMHFCGDTLVETAVFHKAKGCGMEMQKPSKKDCTITKSNCCNDKQLLIDGQDELKLTVDSISFKQQVFITSFLYSYSQLFKGLDKKVSTYETYKEPLVIKQLFKLDETYLI